MITLPSDPSVLSRYKPWSPVNNMKAKLYGPQRFLRRRTHVPTRDGVWFRFVSTFVVHRALRRADDRFVVQVFWHRRFYVPGKFHTGPIRLPELDGKAPHAVLPASAFHKFLPCHRARQERTSFDLIKGRDKTTLPALLTNDTAFPCELLRPLSLLLRGDVALSVAGETLTILSAGVAAIVTRTRKGKDGSFAPRVEVQKLDVLNRPVQVPGRVRQSARKRSKRI